MSLIHVKVGVHSSRLSHLFSQGYVGSLELLTDSDATKHFERVIEASALSPNDMKSIIRGVADRKNLRAIFAIITKKTKELKSDALPLFSRINLQRVVRSLMSMGIDPVVQLIVDDYRKV